MRSLDTKSEYFCREIAICSNEYVFLAGAISRHDAIVHKIGRSASIRSGLRVLICWQGPLDYPALIETTTLEATRAILDGPDVNQHTRIAVSILVSSPTYDRANNGPESGCLGINVKMLGDTSAKPWGARGPTALTRMARELALSTMEWKLRNDNGANWSSNFSRKITEINGSYRISPTIESTSRYLVKLTKLPA